ncbi:MAG: M23 family metallopeptidase [Candidatus Eremiobacteraeota bacterium]|nr:M23 family metallopeptidase [Candidatus Eremiobacteraeota bacterium]
MAKSSDAWSKRVLIKIIPHDARSIYKLELTHGHLALFAICIVVLVAAFVTMHVAQVRAEEAKVHALQRLTATQQQQLLNFSDQTNHMWQQLNKIQAEHQQLQRLTVPAGGVSTDVEPAGSVPVNGVPPNGVPANAAPAKHDDSKPSKPTAMIMIEPSMQSLPVHGPWWTQAVGWLGIGRGGVTFETESASLALLDVGMDRVYSDTVRLKDEAQRAEQVREAASLAYQRMLEAIPSIWPTDGAISSGFGFRSYPDYGFHSGLDIVNYYGAPILATAAGTVVSAGWDGGFGIKVEIDHGNGYMTWYAHCSEALVSAGQFVRKGQQIARLGSTGFATGPHVHYEVHEDGRPINPVPFLSGSVGPTPAQLASLR